MTELEKLEQKRLAEKATNVGKYSIEDRAEAMSELSKTKRTETRLVAQRAYRDYILEEENPDNYRDQAFEKINPDSPIGQASFGRIALEVTSPHFIARALRKLDYEEEISMQILDQIERTSNDEGVQQTVALIREILDVDCVPVKEEELTDEFVTKVIQNTDELKDISTEDMRDRLMGLYQLEQEGLLPKEVRARLPRPTQPDSNLSCPIPSKNLPIANQMRRHSVRIIEDMSKRYNISDETINSCIAKCKKSGTGILSNPKTGEVMSLEEARESLAMILKLKSENQVSKAFSQALDLFARRATPVSRQAKQQSRTKTWVPKSLLGKIVYIAWEGKMPPKERK